MNIDKRITRLILRKRPFGALFQGISNIRKNPTIDLRTTLTCLFLMAFFSLTSLLSLDREAALVRWQIENNLFTRLRHLAGTKQSRIKDPRACLNWLHLLCAAEAALHALLHILMHHPLALEALRDGIKFTSRNLFSHLLDGAEGPLFVPHPTASG